LHEIQVALGARSYPILVASGLIDKLDEYIPNTGKKALVTTPVVYDLYGERVKASLGDHELILIPDGEEAKQWSVIEELIGKLIDAGLDRQSTIIALGGGTVGDVAGFAASIYLRGIKVVQVPTTLLAMVDSSIGGKTAVNHPKGKNLVGSFHQPDRVLIDPSLLETLPDSEIKSGLAEVIKYGVIHDEELFKLLERKSLRDLSPDDMVEIIARCAATKARYVEQDEEDRKGIRAALNYGHTLGHAVETLTNHSVSHGEGVAIGMAAAVWISRENGLIMYSDYYQIINLIENYGLPTKVPSLDHDSVIEVMHRDKKAEQGQIRFVLPIGIGRSPVLRYVGDETIRRLLEAHS
jgi:3-dehydroquinate synthase